LLAPIAFRKHLKSDAVKSHPDLPALRRAAGEIREVEIVKIEEVSFRVGSKPVLLESAFYVQNKSIYLNLNWGVFRYSVF
jgi:hypothetical protein